MDKDHKLSILRHILSVLMVKSSSSAKMLTRTRKIEGQIVTREYNERVIVNFVNLVDSVMKDKNDTG